MKPKDQQLFFALIITAFLGLLVFMAIWLFSDPGPESPETPATGRAVLLSGPGVLPPVPETALLPASRAELIVALLLVAVSAGLGVCHLSVWVRRWVRRQHRFPMRPDIKEGP